MVVSARRFKRSVAPNRGGPVTVTERQRFTLAQRLVAEGIGTAMLLAAVVGSGIMGERLAGGNAALALLANTLATGAALVALILTLGPISGAHLNPAVTLTSGVSRHVALRYIGAQFAGAIVGAIVANVMFGLPAVSLSQHERSGLVL